MKRGKEQMEGYRTCPYCDFKNHNLESLECQKCGQDLSTVDLLFPVSLLQSNDNGDAPVSSEKGDTASSRTLIPGQIKLVSESGDYEIQIPFKGGVIGREGDLSKEYFENHFYVSRIHAQIFYKGTSCYILDRGSANGTLINDLKLEPDKQQQLMVGDTVVFADVSFRVKAGN